MLQLPRVRGLAHSGHVGSNPRQAIGESLPVHGLSPDRRRRRAGKLATHCGWKPAKLALAICTSGPAGVCRRGFFVTLPVFPLSRDQIKDITIYLLTLRGGSEQSSHTIAPMTSAGFNSTGLSGAAVEAGRDMSGPGLVTYDGREVLRWSRLHHVPLDREKGRASWARVDIYRKEAGREGPRQAAS